MEIFYLVRLFDLNSFIDSYHIGSAGVHHKCDRLESVIEIAVAVYV